MEEEKIPFKYFLKFCLRVIDPHILLVKADFSYAIESSLGYFMQHTYTTVSHCVLE